MATTTTPTSSHNTTMGTRATDTVVGRKNTWMYWVLAAIIVAGIISAIMMRNQPVNTVAPATTVTEPAAAPAPGTTMDTTTESTTTTAPAQ